MSKFTEFLEKLRAFILEELTNNIATNNIVYDIRCWYDCVNDEFPTKTEFLEAQLTNYDTDIYTDIINALKKYLTEPKYVIDMIKAEVGSDAVYDALREDVSVIYPTDDDVLLAIALLNDMYFDNPTEYNKQEDVIDELGVEYMDKVYDVFVKTYSITE